MARDGKSVALCSKLISFPSDGLKVGDLHCTSIIYVMLGLRLKLLGLLASGPGVE